MRMAHIYQPLMLMTLLENKGRAHQKQIATSLLAHDDSQIDYYVQITNNMVGKVLRKHGIVNRNNESKEYLLNGFENLTEPQILALIKLCESKLSEFISSRKSDVFQHRRRSSGYISGTIRYEVLKRAKLRCELCGISGYEKALEVDHIIPRNKGGSDDISNFQSLCYSCNAMKSDRDNTDFRDVVDSYKLRHKGCLFCEIPSNRIISNIENELAYAIYDGFPVTEHHALIIPKRHVATYFELGQAEINATNQLIKQLKDKIDGIDGMVSGYNIGINAGESAGQSIFHCHIHIIPRRYGDVENPKGGVRHTIPGKGFY